jgi:hypothetical protein
MLTIENKITKWFCFFSIIFLPKFIQAQHLKTNLCGVYVNYNSLYENFTFQTTGQVWNNASLMDTPRDYFQYNDTVVVYPDKDVFRFIVQKDGSLKGISYWVKDSIWVKLPNDTTSCTSKIKVTNVKLQQMYAYEQLMLLAADKNKADANGETILTSLQNLCDSGYGRACHSLALYTNYFVENGTEKSIIILEKGCNANDAVCCRLLADEYRNMNKIEMAILYYDKSCKMGDFEACLNDLKDSLKKSSKKIPSKIKMNKKKKIVK